MLEGQDMYPAEEDHHPKGHRGVRAAAPLFILSCLFFVALHPRFLAAVPGQSSISVTTELVVVPVSVTDSKGTFVSGLEIANFRVLEDGRPQKITLFADEDNPVTVGLIVDHSRSMGPKLPGVAEAVLTFAHSSNAQDEMFVVDFSDSVYIERFGGKNFTTDPKELEKAVSAVTAGGRTALYDGIIEGLHQLQQGRSDKKALVVVSDGGDNASHHKFADALDLARKSHALIYAIGLIGESGEEENPGILKKLCRETGGIAFFPRPQESVADVSKKIARDLREQYTLGYAPVQGNDNQAFHKLAVEVSVPGRGKLHVRTRPGYTPKKGNDSTSQSARSTP